MNKAARAQAIHPVMAASSEYMSASCAKLVEKVYGLEKVKDIRELRPLLARRKGVAT